MYIFVYFITKLYSSFSEGARACNTHLYKSGSYPLDLIGPAIVIWEPFNRPGADDRAKSSKRKRGKKKKGNEEKSDENKIRHLWIRCHALNFETIFMELQKAIASVISTSKKTDSEWEIVITDFRRHFNIFDLTGPKSSQVIKGALTPVEGEKRDEFRHVSFHLYHPGNVY